MRELTDQQIADNLDQLWSEHERILKGPRRTEIEHAIAAAHLELGRRHFQHLINT